MKWITLALICLLSSIVSADIKHFVRYEAGQKFKYGELKNNKIQPLAGDIFDKAIPEGTTISVDDVKLLLPVVPQKVFAVGMNFDSHMSSPSNAPPPLFLKLPSSLILSHETIVLPNDANNVHFEGELVLVIGKRAKNISEKEAPNVIFGVAAGNDLTERSWQGQDLQWMRSKAADGFGPIGTTIATGVDYNDVLLTTRLNGEIVQQESTKFMIHKPAKVVSYLSKYFTLLPGDLIFMGTPGRTKALSSGDKVSVTIEDVGFVENIIQ